MISSFPLIVPSTFQQVADIIDRNQDNIITVGEIVVGFGEILDYRCMSSPILIFVHFRSSPSPKHEATQKICKQLLHTMSTDIMFAWCVKIWFRYISSKPVLPSLVN